MSLKDIKNPTYFELNNQINIPVNGQIPLNKDKEAVTAFLNENVKPNRLFTYHPNTGVKTHESLNADVSSYMDKLEWLIKNDYYEEPFIRAYKPEFIEELRAWLHKQNFTFYSFMAAYKFYKQYALKTNNGEYYLEDPEDRALMNALYQANGDEELAKDLARVVITRRYQPATPTYANNGRKRRGEFASCFPAGTMISTNMGKLPIEKIEKGMLVLTHDSTYKPVLETMSRQSEEIVEIKIAGQTSTIKTTPEHPFLTTSLKNFVKHPKSEFTEGITRHTFWSEAKDLEKSDYVAVAVEPHNEISTYIDSWDLLKDFTNGYGAHTLLLDNSVAVETIDTKNNRKKGTTINTRINPIPSKINLDADLGRFVGYYLAEGNLIKRDATSIHGIQLTFNSKATSIIEDTIQIIKTKFGYDAKIDKRNDGSTVVAIHNQLLGTVFYKLIGTGFDKKILNETLLGAPKEFLYNLMIGVFRGDGTQTATYNRLQLTNRELIYQLRMIALQLKLLPYTVDLVVKYNKSDASALTISGISQENVDFLNNLHNGKLELRPSSNKDIAFWLDGYAFYKVRKIDQNVNKTKVYNMDVEGNHTYVANNIIVHNCFIIQVQDNMSDIGRSITNALQLSRKAGGVGLILGNLRAAGSPIKKMDGLASGVLPVMKLFEDSFSYSNQLGTRPGAGVAYLPIFHADVMEFLSSKKENADEKIRLKTLSLGLTVPDKFYELAKAGSKMAIFDPYFVEKELGQSFTYVDMDKEYEHLVELSKQVDEETGMPKIRVKWIEARALEQAISELQQESGYPYIINISTANKANPIEGRILGSNLCSEILQIQTPSVINEQQEYTTLGQDIVCNLGSTNIINMMSAGESFGNDIIAMTKGLTFISDASDLAFVQTIDNGNSKNHAIGLGAMGLHSFLANNQIQYESKDAVDFTGLYFLLLNYYTIMGSMQIAKERKQAFDNFENSTYATGEYFDKYLTTDYTDGVSDRVMKLFKDIHIPTAEDWAQLKAEVQEHGMFNAYRIALAPNGSISYVNDCSASIAPIVNRIEERQEGQVGKIYYPTFGLSNESIPYFKSAYDQDMRWQIRIYEAATEHTDQGLSMNMYLRSNFEEHPGLYEWKDGGTTALTTRDLTILRHFAWRHGIKSMYYTRQYTADSDSEHGGANECESCMI